MDLRHLESFAAAVELRSFTRAAELLAITQPAVSQHVAALEKELRVALFRRLSRSVAPTEEGERLYGYARQILDLMDEARQTGGRDATTASGTVRIATCTIPPESLLPELLARFRKEYPSIRESVLVSDSAEAARAVADEDADLGIVVKPPSDSTLHAQAIACIQMVLVVPPGHRLARAEIVTPAQLRGEQFIVREQGSGSRYCFEQSFEDVGISHNELAIAMEMNSNEAIRSAVEQESGVAFLSRTAVQRDIASGRLVAVRVEGVQACRHLYLINDPGRIPTPAARAFLAFVRPPQGVVPNPS